MRFLPLVWKNLFRKKTRTALTLLSIFVCFFLYGLLSAVRTGFGLGVELTGQDRLLVIHRSSIVQPLPLSYFEVLRAQEGIADVSYASWLGGIYQDPRNRFAQLGVEPESFLRLYPEVVLPAGQKQAWLKNRTGAIVGRATAERFGWKIGDQIPIQGTIFRPRDGSSWVFQLEGIYDGADENTDTSQLFFHYDYLREAAGLPSLVGWYVLRVSDPKRATETAERIDRRFANSSAETKTSSEKAFIQSFASQVADVGAITIGILGVVFFTLLVVVGTTMTQVVRERFGELAILKAVGFTDLQVLLLVLAESLLFTLLGGGTGLGLAFWITQTRNLGGSFLPTLHITRDALGLGVALILGIAILTAALPAVQAMRLRITDALRRV